MQSTIYEILLKGLLLGFSTGQLCLLTCTPVYLPFLLTEKRSIYKSFLKVMEISAGRFFSYLTFGALAGFTGSKISTINRSLFTSIAYVLLSVFLLLSIFRIVNNEKKCHIPKITRFTKSAFLLGVLTGLNFCPSFLIALSSAINLGGIIDGISLFTGFFLGTSAFLIPLAFIGGLSKISKIKVFAKYASIIVAVFFLYKGSIGLYHLYQNHQLIKNSRVIEAFSPGKELTVLTDKKNFLYFVSLKDSLKKNHNGEIHLHIVKNRDDIETSNLSSILFIDALLLKNDYFSIEAQYPISKMLPFLKKFAFKSTNPLLFEFKKTDDARKTFEKKQAEFYNEKKQK